MIHQHGQLRVAEIKLRHAPVHSSGADERSQFFPGMRANKTEYSGRPVRAVCVAPMAKSAVSLVSFRRLPERTKSDQENAGHNFSHVRADFIKPRNKHALEGTPALCCKL
jgi:hypothetical protein